MHPQRRTASYWKGSIPSALNPGRAAASSTPDAPRCMDICKQKAPERYQVSDDHYVYRHLYDDKIKENKGWKLFISADIEGCAGGALAYETHKNEAAYGGFAKQMTKEVVAACEAAHEAGADEIVVKDG
ncbi:MAG: M55 family metallopeptidase, partial [Enterocloster sp.]